MKLRTTDFDAVLASSPLNSTAGSVTSSGVSYEPTIEYASHQHFETCPPIRQIPKAATSDMLQMVGLTFGRFTVIGMADNQGSTKQPTRWVVRCACGDFEHRKAKAVRNPENSDDCCRKCRHLKTVKKRYAYFGAAPLSSFLKK